MLISIFKILKRIYIYYFIITKIIVWNVDSKSFAFLHIKNIIKWKIDIFVSFLQILMALQIIKHVT